MSFHIPSSEIEITLTNEFPDSRMGAEIEASIFDIQINNNGQNQAVSLFGLHASVTGSFRSGSILTHNNLLG